MDKEEYRFKIIKNRIDMEYKDKLQVRQILFLALIGIPFTIFNILLTMKVENFNILIAVFYVAYIIYDKIKEKNAELEYIRTKLNLLETQFYPKRTEEDKEKSDKK